MILISSLINVLMDGYNTSEEKYAPRKLIKPTNSNKIEDISHIDDNYKIYFISNRFDLISMGICSCGVDLARRMDPCDNSALLRPT